MAIIQVVLDKDLLRAADRAARQARVNRSALIREALRRHLKRIETRELERRDREGYRKHPDAVDEDALFWEREAAWPERRGAAVSLPAPGQAPPGGRADATQRRRLPG